MTPPRLFAPRARRGRGRRTPVWLPRFALAVVVLAGCRYAAGLLVPLAAACVGWLLAAGPVETLRSRGWPRAAGAALLTLAPLLLLAFAVEQAWPATAALLDTWTVTRARLVELLKPLADALPAGRAAYAWAAAHSTPAALQQAAWSSGAALAYGLLAATLLCFFMLAGQRAMADRVQAALGPRRARRWAAALQDTRSSVLAWLRVMVIVNAGLALATGFALAGLGLAHPLAWAAVVFVLVFVPYLGPLLAAGLLATAGLADFGASWLLLLPAIAFLALHAIEAHLVSPWATAAGVRLDRVALLVAVGAGTWAWGLAGGLLAVPMLIAARAALVHTRAGARVHGREGRLALALLDDTPARAGTPIAANSSSTNPDHAHRLRHRNLSARGQRRRADGRAHGRSSARGRP